MGSRYPVAWLLISTVFLPAVGCTTLGQGYRFFLTNCPESGPVQERAFEMVYPEFDLDRHYELLRAMSRRFAIAELGTIDGDPVLLVQQRPDTATRSVLIVAGVHGNEAAAVLGVEGFLQFLVEQADLYSDWEIAVVSPVNPVGLRHRSRYNAAGCDVNRDFADFATEEARMVRRAIEQTEPDVVVALHEGPQDGFFVIATQSANEEVARRMADAVALEGIGLASKHFTGIALGDPGYSVEGGVMTFTKRLLGIDSLGGYGTAGGIAVYTTESAWALDDVAARARSHEIAVRALLSGPIDP